MNKIVEARLNQTLDEIDQSIRVERDSFSFLTRQLEQSGRHLDTLNQEKRAIKDHLEAAK